MVVTRLFVIELHKKGPPTGFLTQNKTIRFIVFAFKTVIWLIFKVKKYCNIGFWFKKWSFFERSSLRICTFYIRYILYNPRLLVVFIIFGPNVAFNLG